MLGLVTLWILNMDTREQTIDERLISAVGSLRVSRVVKRDDWAAEAIFNIAAGDKIEWTPLEWQAVLLDLENCKLKVSDWLEVS